MWKLCSVVSTWLAFYLRLSKIATPSNSSLLSLAGWRRRRLLARTKRVHQQQTTKHEMRKCNETWKATTEIKKNYYEHYASENKLKKIKINCVLLCFTSLAGKRTLQAHSFISSVRVFSADFQIYSEVHRRRRLVSAIISLLESISIPSSSHVSEKTSHSAPNTIQPSYECEIF